MKLTKQESMRVMQTWHQSEHTLRMVMERLIDEYNAALTRRDTEWDTLRDAVEIAAKKQAIADLLKVLSTVYD